MDWLALTLVATLPFIPAIIIDFVNGLKPHVRGSVVFLLPYAVGVIIFWLLYFVFFELPIEIYLLNGVLFWYGATKAYDATKKSVEESFTLWDFDYDDLEDLPNNEI